MTNIDNAIQITAAYVVANFGFGKSKKLDLDRLNGQQRRLVFKAFYNALKSKPDFVKTLAGVKSAAMNKKFSDAERLASRFEITTHGELRWDTLWFTGVSNHSEFKGTRRQFRGKVKLEGFKAGFSRPTSVKLNQRVPYKVAWTGRTSISVDADDAAIFKRMLQSIFEETYKMTKETQVSYRLPYLVMDKRRSMVLAAEADSYAVQTMPELKKFVDNMVAEVHFRESREEEQKTDTSAHKDRNILSADVEEALKSLVPEYGPMIEHVEDDVFRAKQLLSALNADTKGTKSKGALREEVQEYEKELEALLKSASPDVTVVNEYKAEINKLTHAMNVIDAHRMLENTLTHFTDGTPVSIRYFPKGYSGNSFGVAVDSNPDNGYRYVHFMKWDERVARLADVYMRNRRSIIAAELQPLKDTLFEELWNREDITERRTQIVKGKIAALPEVVKARKSKKRMSDATKDTIKRITAETEADLQKKLLASPMFQRPALAFTTPVLERHHAECVKEATAYHRAQAEKRKTRKPQQKQDAMSEFFAQYSDFLAEAAD